MYAGMTLYLTASTIPGATYNWTGPNDFASTNQNPFIVNAGENASGAYNVTATADGFTSSPGDNSHNGESAAHGFNSSRDRWQFHF
ncbi:MAG: immunoglobulin domain-containing protein [Limisphaerales bacterium]